MTENEWRTLWYMTDGQILTWIHAAAWPVLLWIALRLRAHDH